MVKLVARFSVATLWLQMHRRHAYFSHHGLVTQEAINSHNRAAISQPGFAHASPEKSTRIIFFWERNSSSPLGKFCCDPLPQQILLVSPGFCELLRWPLTKSHDQSMKYAKGEGARSMSKYAAEYHSQIFNLPGLKSTSAFMHTSSAISKLMDLHGVTISSRKRPTNRLMSASPWFLYSSWPVPRTSASSTGEGRNANRNVRSSFQTHFRTITWIQKHDRFKLRWECTTEK